MVRECHRGKRLKNIILAAPQAVAIDDAIPAEIATTLRASQ